MKLNKNTKSHLAAGVLLKDGNSEYKVLSVFSGTDRFKSQNAVSITVEVTKASEPWVVGRRLYCVPSSNFYGMEIVEPKIGKAEAFYTGGGIWISAMYLDKDIYYAIDNDWYDDCFAIYDHNDEDQDTDFPCQNMIGFKEKNQFSAEDHEIYSKLKAALDHEISICG